MITRILFMIAFLASPVAHAAQRLTGPDHAKVSILVFGDYQCPFTKKFMEYIPRLEKDFGSQLEISYAHFPLGFHTQAVPAAIAAVCAGNEGKFREYTDKLFANQEHLAEEGFFAKTAAAMNINATDFAACTAAKATGDIVRQDSNTAEALRLTGTPYIYIDGKGRGGVYPYEHYKGIIEKMLKKR